MKNSQQYTRNDIVCLTQNTELSDLQDLSTRERRRWCKDDIFLRAIIEFSNYCQRNCCYCGLRKDNTKVSRYRMSPDEIVEAAVFADHLGYKTIVLQSGEDSAYTIDDLCSMVRKIKEKVDCVITLSLGERSRADYARLKQAGAERYLLKFETSDVVLFKKLKPDSSYRNRLQCLQDLRELGYQTGSGMMVGLPGQTEQILIEDIELLQKLDLDMIGIGPFIAHPDTPLANFENGSLDKTLRVIAAVRIVTGNTHLPATTAIATINSQGRQQALLYGANVIMFNLTPLQYRAKYEIYPNKICVDENPIECAACVEEIVASVGRKINRGYGNSLKIAGSSF